MMDQNNENQPQISERMQRLLDRKAGEGNALAGELLGKTVVSSEKKEEKSDVQKIAESLSDSSNLAEQKKFLGEADIEAEKQDNKASEPVPGKELEGLPVEVVEAGEERAKRITNNLKTALAEVSDFDRSKEGHPAYAKRVADAKDVLESEGVDVDKYIWGMDLTMEPDKRNVELGKRKKRLLNIVGYFEKGGKIEDLSPEHQEILNSTGIKPEDIEVKEVSETPTITVDVPQEEEPARREPARRETPPARARIQTEADVRAEMARIAGYEDPGFKSRAFQNLAGKAHEIGANSDLINQINRLSEGSRIEKTAADARKSAEVPEFTKFTEDSDWIEWGRGRLALYLDPDSEQAMKLKGQSPFAVEKETVFGRNWQDGLLYMPKDIRTQMELEFKTAAELRQMYFVWKKNHESLDNLASEKTADVPSNEQLGRLLNSLSGESGVPGDGSANVSEAIALYARMSLTHLGEKSLLESDHGVGDGLNEEVPSIFNTVLSTEEIAEIRKKIAAKCGSSYYESLGLILAKMMGISAKGSTSLKSGIENADCVGKLIYTRRWNFEGTPNDRWLPLEMAVDGNGKFIFKERNEQSNNYSKDTDRPIKLAVDAFGMQTKGEPNKRGYYLILTDGGKYQVVKDIPEGKVDSGETMGSLLIDGDLNKIDWKGSSFELLTNLKKRNDKSLALYNMLREPMDSKTSFDPDALGKKKELIDSALGQYGQKTKNYVGYLYTMSWLERHSGDWLRRHFGNKAEEVAKNTWPGERMRSYINISKIARLIDSKLAGILNDHYKTGPLRFL